MQYGSSEESAGSDLRVTRGRELQKGIREINESNRKQDVNAMQEKGTKRDRERELRPRVWPLWRLSSEMHEWCRRVVACPTRHGETLESTAAVGVILERGSISDCWIAVGSVKILNIKRFGAPTDCPIKATVQQRRENTLDVTCSCGT